MLNKTYCRQSPNITFDDFKVIFDVLRSTQIETGPFIKRFEQEFANYVGTRYAVMVNMGRTAEYIALLGLNLNKGDEVILPSYNFPIVPIVVKMMGLKPVFVDVDPGTFNIDSGQIKGAITSKTKAILITHMCGHPCEMDEILDIKNKYGLMLIEDAVHSLGAEYKRRKVGTFGDVSYFSFYVGKTMTTFLGAAICTDNEDIYRRINDVTRGYKNLPRKVLLKEMGYGLFTYLFTKPAVFNLSVYPALLGLNMLDSYLLDSRMEEPVLIPERLPPDYLTKFTNLQSAIGLSQLKSLEHSISRRIMNAEQLNKEIEDNPLIVKPVAKRNIKHTYLYYFIRCKNRELFRKKLVFKGVDTKRDSNRACSHLGIFKDEYRNCPVSEALCKENVLIPNYPLLKEKDIMQISQAVNSCLREFNSNG